VSTVDESVATLALGEAFTQTFSKFPRCNVNAMYRQRQFLCGHSQYPNRVYYSLVNDPENMEGYLETRTGEPAIALFVVRDQLYVGCPGSIQKIQGFTSTDFEVTIAEPQIGVINNASIKVIHGYAIVPSQTNWYLCSGAFTPIGNAYQRTWRKEYQANRAAYEDSFAADFRDDNIYELFIGGDQALIQRELDEDNVADVESVSYVLDYSTLLPQAGGTFAPPELSIDVRRRSYDFAFSAAVPGSSRKDTYLGACNGQVYKQTSAEDPDSTADDDGDTYNKKLTIKDGVRFLGDPGGNDLDGKKFHTYWAYITNENNVTTLELRVGDESCDTLIVPSFEVSIPVGLSVTVVTDGATTTTTTKVARNRFFCTPDKEGVGVQYKITCSAPVAGWAFSGFGCTYGPGGNPRGANHEVEIEE
jgi:hypothetical protein